MIEHSLTDSASIYDPNASIFHNSVASYFNFYVIFTFKSSGTCVSRMLDSHGFIRCSPFWFLNPLEYLHKQFSSPVLVFCFGWQPLLLRFLASKLFISIRSDAGRADLFLYFQIKCSSSLLKLCLLNFCAVNSECAVYPVDRSLPWNVSTIFQSNQSWACLKTIFLNSYFGAFVPGSS